MLKLLKPNIELQSQYIEMMQDWIDNGENLVPWVLKIDYKDFQKMIEILDNNSNGVGLKENYVPSSTFWLSNKDNKILGVVNIRHYLNKDLEFIGGHIGYGIRPSERKKGYATEILKQSLEFTKKLGIKRVLVTCDKINIGSAKTILNNFGKLDSEVEINEKIVQRYWIDNFIELE
jgi:predicted acetyltransferase